jgi:hypothetical protein
MNTTKQQKVAPRVDEKEKTPTQAPKRRSPDYRTAEDLTKKQQEDEQRKGKSNIW